MAKIIKDGEQEIALKSVSQYLKDLRKIKEFDDILKTDYKLKITAKSVDSTAVHFGYEIEENIAKSVINDYRKNIVKKITKLTNEYRIGLDAEEKALLENFN
jgi:predicted transcriptional regulator